MRDLITGGAGFIGSHLAEQLLQTGDHVTVLDNLSTGRESNLAAARSSQDFRFIRDSVENESTVAIAVAQCDVIYHLAAAVGVQLIVDQPVLTIHSLIHGTEVVLDAAHRFGKPVLIASSSEADGAMPTAKASMSFSVLLITSSSTFPW
jgi:UDP-glucose 4-epimerase